MNTRIAHFRYGVENTADYLRAGLLVAARLQDEDIRDFVISSNEVLMGSTEELTASLTDVSNWYQDLPDGPYKLVVEGFISRAKAILNKHAERLAQRAERRARRAEQEALAMFSIASRIHRK